MIAGIPLELIVAAVLGVDAVVVAGFIMSRRRSRRSTSAAADGSLLAAERHPEPWWSGPQFGGSARAEPRARGAWVRDTEVAGAEVPPASSPPVEGGALPADVEPRPAEADARPVEPAAAPRPWPGEADLSAAWVDPLTMAAEATAAWRRTLRRDLLRAGSRGRAGVLIHLELDVEGLAADEVARSDGLLFDAIAKVVRPTDHFDRTGPARFHLLLWEIPTTNAQTVARRIEQAFGDSAPGGLRLLVGLEAVISEAELGPAIQSAAEQVDEARRAARG